MEITKKRGGARALSLKVLVIRSSDSVRVHSALPCRDIPFCARDVRGREDDRNRPGKDEGTAAQHRGHLRRPLTY